MEAKDIVAAFGGIRAMADKLGHRNHTTVQGWADRNAIPARQQRAILDAAKRFRVPVGVHDLIAPASKAAA